MVNLVLFSGLLKVAAAGGSGSAPSCSGSSSGRRLGGGAPWYCEDWENDHLEATSAAVMLILAIAFEHIYHELFHKAEHSFVYGQSMLSEDEKEAHVNSADFSKPLRLVLLERMGGEFMVLGFLAFSIWTLNQQNLFSAIADAGITDPRLPSTGSDFLHIMEAVHMQLFVAMILYFALCFKVVLGADQRIREFEKCRSDWVAQLMAGTGTNYETDAPALRAFKYGRGHFLDGAVKEILNWQETQQHTFKEVMHSMKVEKACGTVQLEDLKKVFTDRFSFASYLVFSLCSTTMYTINMSQKTMFGIIFIKAMLAVLHRWAHVPNKVLSPVFGGMCLLFLLWVSYTTAIFKKSLAHKEVQPIPGLSWLPGVVGRVSRSADPGRLMLSTLQVLLFFLCHAWAGYVIRKSYWDAVFQEGNAADIVIGLAYIVALTALAVILPRIIPDFSTVMALPPFFTIGNQQMIQLVAVQVVDQKMVAAREALKKKLEDKKALEEAGNAQKDEDQLQPKHNPLEPKDQEKESPREEQTFTSEAPPVEEQTESREDEQFISKEKSPKKKPAKRTSAIKSSKRSGKPTTPTDVPNSSQE